jgi:hypothetical protein
VYNPTQLNSDGARRDNGDKIPRLGGSTPNQDKLGDACDWDDDNDSAFDVYETTTSLTLPLNNDTDGDTIQDGTEIRIAIGPDPTVDPLNPALKPVWSNLQQTYFRGCQIHVNITDHPTFVEEDGTADGVEMDVDGDGVLCAVSGATDADSDNGGVGHEAKTEVNDNVEAFGYNTSIAQPDTDSDGCEDWVEIHDMNGDRKVTGADSLYLAKAVSGSTPVTDPVSKDIYDVNQSGTLTGGDLLQLAKNTCSAKGWGGCPAGCAAEN